MATDKVKVMIITPEQIAHAFGVPLEMVGLLPPDYADDIPDWVKDQLAVDLTVYGSAYAVKGEDGMIMPVAPHEVILTKEDGPYVYATGGVLKDSLPPLADCSTNNAPYVPGQLGINCYLTQKTEQDMPHKTFQVGEPDPDKPLSQIPAHEVFTSPLIHGVKPDGPVKTQQLDEHGDPTGHWITLGQVKDFPGLEHQWAWQTQAAGVSTGEVIDDYSDVPEGYYIKEDPDWGDQLVPIPQAESQPLFDVPAEPPKPLIHPDAHLWCTACAVHWMAHTGDPVECDSGGWLRRSTPLEDKQYVDRMRMLKETGLL